jgi:hypothetical protein
VNRTNEAGVARNGLSGVRVAAIAMLCVGAAWVTSSARAQNPSGHSPADDRPNTHNMLVVGERTVFLSHLPMFDELNRDKTAYTSPHRFQVILEATFSDHGKSVQNLYTNDRKAHPGIKMYTLSPEPMVLAKLFTPDPQHPSVTSFRATVFRGHLERGGQPIPGLKNIDVTVKRVILAREFDPAETKAGELEYLLLGMGNELFLAHRISNPPDFDQVLAIKIGDPPLTEDQLSRGLTVTINNQKNASSQRITQGQKVTGKAHAAGAHEFLNLQIQAVTELYFEEGELALPATMDQTPEEKKAGF